MERDLFREELEILAPHIEDDLRMEAIFEHVTDDCQCEGKRCTQCKEVKCRGRFYRDKRNTSGLQSECRKCNIACIIAVRHDPTLRHPKYDLKTRFLSKVDIHSDKCWHWTGQVNQYGYGVLKVKRKPIQAYRIAYELYKGPIPEGLSIDHLCCNRLCVNPDHLEAVTPRENTLRAFARRQKSLDTWLDLYRDLYREFHGEHFTEQDLINDIEERKHRLGLDSDANSSHTYKIRLVQENLKWIHKPT